MIQWQSKIQKEREVITVQMNMNQNNKKAIFFVCDAVIAEQSLSLLGLVL